MTENEAIKILEEHTQYFIPANDADALYTVLDIIQQYREIGTVEECKTAMDLQKHLEEADNNLYKILLRCSEYEQIGTVEECREAVEKQKAQARNESVVGKIPISGKKVRENNGCD